MENADVPAPMSLALTTLTVTGYVVVVPPPCAGTLTVVGSEPVQAVPSNCHWVFTEKLAALAWLFLTVYVTTITCDAVAEQL